MFTVKELASELAAITSLDVGELSITVTAFEPLRESFDSLNADAAVLAAVRAWMVRWKGDENANGRGEDRAKDVQDSHCAAALR